MNADKSWCGEASRDVSRADGGHSSSSSRAPSRALLWACRALERAEGAPVTHAVGSGMSRAVSRADGGQSFSAAVSGRIERRAESAAHGMGANVALSGIERAGTSLAGTSLTGAVMGDATGGAIAGGAKTGDAAACGEARDGASLRPWAVVSRAEGMAASMASIPTAR